MLGGFNVHFEILSNMLLLQTIYLTSLYCECFSLSLLNDCLKEGKIKIDPLNFSPSLCGMKASLSKESKLSKLFFTLTL